MEILSDLSILEQAPELALSLGLFAIGMASWSKTRKDILDRDNNESQMRHYDEERGWHTDVDHCEDGGQGCTHTQVHHIQPRRAGGGDDSDNLITLYECQHTGRCPSEKIKKGYYRE